MIAAERVSVAARSLVQRTRLAHSLWVRALCLSILLCALPFVFRLDGRVHGDWLQFFGRFHPALLHLPIGLIILVPVLEFAGRRRSELREAADFVLRCALAVALPTFALGYMLAYGSGDTGTTIVRHLWGAVLVCIGLALCVVTRRSWIARETRFAYPLLLSTTVLALLWTGHQGGSITHGSDYLTRYMPASLQRLSPSTTLKGVSPDSFYVKRIHPVLDAKCVACHGAANMKGGLRLDSYENLMRGGKDGAVIVPGKPEASVLLARVTLTPGDSHFMPAEGRTPLTTEEISWIREWIHAGATATAPGIPGFRIADNPEPPPQPVGDYSQLMPEIIALQQSLGAKLVPVSIKASDGLILRTVDVSSSFGDAELAKFQKFAPYIVEAELARTQVTDAAFETLGTFTHLRVLHLENTRITGTSLAKLKGLNELAYLNLSGTKVNSSSLASLKSMTHLRHLYLFDTPAQSDETTARSNP